MSNLSFYISFLFLLLFGNKQVADTTEPITLCTTGPEEMKAFLDDPAFAAFHPEPEPFDFDAKGEMVNFPASDGKNASGYLLRASSPSDKWLFVFQEWWGLNDNIKSEAEKFHADLAGKVNVLALDMYDGGVATTAQDAMGLMRGTDEGRLTNIVKAAQSYAGESAKIANVGWCFGGSWSLKSALLLGNQNVGAVIYYGMPVRDVEQLKLLSSDVLGLFATEQNISKAVIEEFATAMDQAGKKLDYKIYDAVHGFANPSNAKHDPEATKEAYAKAINYLKGKFE
jgi:carboxymethylenebutenolidase